MYRHVKASHPSTFHRALAQIAKYPNLANFVRTLDLSNACSSTNFREPFKGFNPVRAALHRTPLVREFRINEAMEQYLDFDILQKLFSSSEFMETLDLSGCKSPRFVEGCRFLFEDNRAISTSLKSLDLAGCSNLPPEFFESLLPQLPQLQHLNVSNTQITSTALSNIPPTARLYHLNVSYCYVLDGKKVVDFLAYHSAVKQLAYLAMNTHPGIEHQIFSEEDVSKVLSNLPSTLRTLNFKNSAMTSAHAPLLHSISTRLGELGVGSHLSFRDIENLFLNPETLTDEETAPEILDEDDPRQAEFKYKAILTPMEEAVAVCKLRQRISSVPFTPTSTKTSKLRYLDISGLPVSEQTKIQMSFLLGPQTMPLEIIEISEKGLGSCGVLPKLCAAVGWELKTLGRRCWMRRKVFE